MALESTLELPDEMEDSLEASGRLPDNNAVSNAMVEIAFLRYFNAR
jgi:hypothetical protein